MAISTLTSHAAQSPGNLAQPIITLDSPRSVEERLSCLERDFSMLHGQAQDSKESGVSMSISMKNLTRHLNLIDGAMDAERQAREAMSVEFVQFRFVSDELAVSLERISSRLEKGLVETREALRADQDPCRRGEPSEALMQQIWEYIDRVQQDLKNPANATDAALNSLVQRRADEKLFINDATSNGSSKSAVPQVGLLPGRSTVFSSFPQSVVQKQSQQSPKTPRQPTRAVAAKVPIKKAQPGQFLPLRHEFVAKPVSVLPSVQLQGSIQAPVAIGSAWAGDNCPGLIMPLKGTSPSPRGVFRLSTPAPAAGLQSTAVADCRSASCCRFPSRAISVPAMAVGSPCDVHRHVNDREIIIAVSGEEHRARTPAPSSTWSVADELSNAGVRTPVYRQASVHRDGGPESSSHLPLEKSPALLPLGCTQSPYLRGRMLSPERVCLSVPTPRVGTVIRSQLA